MKMFKCNKSTGLHCLCATIDPVLKVLRWFGILPLMPVGQKHKHFVNGCQFQISKFWLTLSLSIQIIYIPYILMSSIMRVYYGHEINNQDGFGWYIMTIGYIALETDCAVTLITSTLQAKSLGRILERLSRLPSSFHDLRKISRQLNVAVLIFMIVYFTLMSSFIIESLSRMNKVDISPRTILDSTPGVFIRGLSGIYPQMQCVIVVMMCLIISSKFTHLAQSTELSLRKASHFSNNLNLVRPVTVEWMNSGKDITGLTASHLEQLGDLYREISDCVAELNKSVGFQNLVALTANLYVIIYQLYKFTTSYGRFGISAERQYVHSVLSLANLFLKLMLYMSMGQLIKSKHREPAAALQRGKVLHLPSRLQQQIQTLMLQWSFTESGYLSAFHVLNIGPWLLAPIVGNVVTYLLVAIQLDKAAAPLAVNLTAYLESII